MSCLVIGAGAVGQVFALALQQGGVDVSFYVRPTKEQKETYAVFDLNGSTRREIRPVSHLTTFEEISAGLPWHSVWLCTSSLAVEDTEFMRGLVECIGSGTHLIVCTPGMYDYQKVRAMHERTSFASVPFLAWQAPIEGETVSPTTTILENEFGLASDMSPGAHGVAYYLPFGAAVAVSGDEGVIQSVVGILTQGGLPTATATDATMEAVIGGAVITPLVIGLEKENWNYGRLMRSPRLRTVCGAACDLLQIVRHTHNSWMAFFLRLVLYSFVLRIILRVAVYILPFDVGREFAFHFGDKHREQTYVHVRNYQQTASELRLDLPNLTALLESEQSRVL